MHPGLDVLKDEGYISHTPIFFHVRDRRGSSGGAVHASIHIQPLPKGSHPKAEVTLSHSPA